MWYVKRLLGRPFFETSWERWVLAWPTSLFTVLITDAMAGALSVCLQLQEKGRRKHSNTLSESLKSCLNYCKLGAHIKVWLHDFLHVTCLVTFVLVISNMSCAYFSSFRIWYCFIELSQSQPADAFFLSYVNEKLPEKTHKPRSNWVAVKSQTWQGKWKASSRGKFECREANSGHQQGLVGTLEINKKADPKYPGSQVILQWRCHQFWGS